jgi:hypothetical protein
MVDSLPSACLAAATGRCDLNDMQLYDVLLFQSVCPFPPPIYLRLTTWDTVCDAMGILPLRQRGDGPSGHTRLVRENWLTIA